MSLHLGYMWFNTPSHSPPAWLLATDRSPPWLCPQISLNRAPPHPPAESKRPDLFFLMDVADASKSASAERFWSRSLQLLSDVGTFVTTPRLRLWRLYWGGGEDPLGALLIEGKMIWGDFGKGVFSSCIFKTASNKIKAILLNFTFKSKIVICKYFHWIVWST